MVSIVVVEDHPLMCDAIVSALSDEFEFEVIGTCHDGATAVKLVLEARPDVVVMDLRLPIIDGLEATQRISHDWPEARIVIHTSASFEEREAVLDFGAVDIVIKSVDPTHLMRAIRFAALSDPPRTSRTKLGHGG